MWFGVAELKTKLEATERFLSTLEKKLPLPPSQKEGDSPRDPAPEQQQRQEKGQESLNRELHELKKENKLLKENNALASRKKEHYECEIRRLNKALQEALGRECSPLPEDRLGRPEKGCSREEMRTEMEVLKQQVQIYEEDFHRERSDRERLNREKEELQQINQTSQSQLNKLKSQMKACQMEKEQLEKQLTQMHLPTCRCSLGSHLRDPCAPTGPGAEQSPQQHPVSSQKRKPVSSCVREQRRRRYPESQPGRASLSTVADACPAACHLHHCVMFPLAWTDEKPVTAEILVASEGPVHCQCPRREAGVHRGAPMISPAPSWV
uniref:TNFAIP3 interacting protein 3 n=1 Tax=Molossus molossus TaxID=27622 RepID=A0A7J8IEH0_MOLMO|nr:TNFAIP3 interacting protein 3 [Molossus molossus]